MNRNGVIEYEEFLSATVKHSNVINEENLKAAFGKFDKDNSGKLSVDELVSLVGNDMDLVMELLTKVDKNNDGEVSYEEFKTLMSMMVGEKERLKQAKKKKTTKTSNTIIDKKRNNKS